MPGIRKFRKFRDVMKEVNKKGAAIYENPAGTHDLVVLSPYNINYIHSYAEDTPFFLGLAEGKLMGSECKKCHYRYATPRSHCMECGSETEWSELPLEGRVHSWTTCYFGSEEFLKETPFNLALVEFDGVDTLFLSRLKGAEERDIYIGMKVKAVFRKAPKYLVSDVHFVPAEPKAKK
ncbi:MAG: Zn-ribbon domain-containing OB-fold protein [Nitrososphaerota archaeon]|nr:Zn-ribbon domain-containing OB-fold protein [Nitrososphaerota archaeon]MDG6968312.1 Zn-ribbon domain-containing OB-fold protein [Nitrososphaerota archaeon]MDG6975151.1 Zn-ribbon domain-containing OB-fold protein [Nitrososphaerota archaeon]MDG7009539.1 Zn-ribbon domain-containing OB-fold protein [Nitrososphaerota archaeon]MDG7019299.1 Zn-ribbon domain-containing OB-fold protein [Nitrososphaerota archaeon]